jgi:hypothetical protein
MPVVMTDQINRPSDKLRRNFHPQPLEHTVVDHLYGRPSNRDELRKTVADNGPTGPIGPVSMPAMGIKLDSTLLAGVVGGVVLKGMIDNM